MTGKRSVARVGVAAFAVGLALAGPRAVGLATADEAERGSAGVSAGQADARGDAVRGARSAQPRTALRAGERDGGGRNTDSEVGPLADEAPDHVAAATVSGDPKGASEARNQEPPGAPPAADSSGTADRRASLAAPEPVDTPARPLLEVSRLTGQVAALVPKSALPAPTAAQPALSAVTPPEPPRAVAASAVGLFESVNQTVVGLFESTEAWLSGLPGGPLADFLSGALLLVRRTLFNQVPLAGNPVQLTTNSVGQVSGSLGATDPEGDALTYTLIELPQFGAVQISRDGEYVYSPGPDFAGTDSFTVEVRDNGLNVLNPFGNRAVAIEVLVPDESLGPLVGKTTGYNIKNMSGQAVMLVKLEKEKGYENDVQAQPLGAVIPIGGTYHIELTDYAFLGYTTRWEFAPCVEINCEGGRVDASDPWVVTNNNSSVLGPDSDSFGCDGYRRCEDDKGRGVDLFPDSSGLDRLRNRTVVLVDDPGTKRTISGEQAQKQAAVIATVCSTNGAYCNFISTGPVTTSTIGGTKIFNNNSRGEQDISNTYTVDVAATSSTKYTYSQEASGNFGVKDSWGLAFKAAFGQELSSTNSLQTTTTVAIKQVLPPFTRGIATVGVEADRVTGTYTAKIRNTEFTLTDVWFDFPRSGNRVESYDWTTADIPRT